MQVKEHALYKGDELIGTGTVKELADKFGVKPSTISYYHTPTYISRTSETKGRRLIEL